MAKSDLDKDSLKIGDYIVLTDAQLGCFLGVEGILLEDLVGVDSINNLHDCIFCVHLQRQYSASRELNAFLEKYNMDVKSITEESELRYLAALERGMENENKLNDNYMRKKLGQVVSFGDVIQLYHVKSGKYLHVVNGKLAKEERENTRVGLDVNGSPYSYLMICPRFKIDKEGDRILSNVEAYFKVAEKGSEYIHSAERDPPAGQEREVNCSLESTSWRINIFQSSTDAVDTSLLMASQLVYIHDPETRANLALAAKPTVNFVEEENAADKVSTFVAQESEEDMRAEDEPEEEEEQVVLRPSTSKYLDSNFLWILEASSILAGGPIKWKTDQVRFKHLNTGLYLCQETKHTLALDGASATKSWRYVTTADANAIGTLFSVHELNSTAKFLCSGKASQIGHGSVLMERGPILPDSFYSYKLQGTKDKSAAVSLIVNSYFGHGIGTTDDEPSVSSAVKKGGKGGEGEDSDEEDAGAKKNSGPAQPLDVFAGLSARNYLEKYYKMTVLNSNSNTIWPTASRTDMDLFKMIVSKTVIFTQGFPISAQNVKIGIDKSDPELRRRRQNLLREQNTLEIVLRLIHKLVPLSEAAVERPTAANVDSSFLTKMGRAVLDQCFSVLYSALQDNQANQMYVADYMPVLLAHLNTQPIAVKCVTEMLSKNLELQETKITPREIQIFVDKLRSSKMNAMYLQLLQACCSCEGKGVDGNQCKVANMLFEGDFSDIIVTLEANYSKLHKVSWGADKVLYLSPPAGSDAKLFGVDLFRQGVPQLTLRWQRAGTDSTMSAPIEEIFAMFTPPGAGGAAGPPQLSRSQDEADAEQAQKPAPLLAQQSSFKSHSFKMRMGGPGEMYLKVGNYFVAEMFLGAEMCMDRNYVAINKLKDLFTYEMLVSILAMESLSSNVKSAAVRLLMCLHVDRDPQAASKIPLLTRSWSDIKKNPEPQLPYVEVNRRYDFGLIQQLLSEHIKGMSGRRWDDLSRHMLKMLRTLVQFNFYGTNERMKDVIAPLIMALDRRGLDLASGNASVANKSQKNLLPGGGAGDAGSSQPGQDSFDESESFDRNAASEVFLDDDNVSDLSSQADLRYSVKSKARKQQFQQLLDWIDSYRCFQLVLALVFVDIGVDIYHLITRDTFAFPSIIFLIEAATMFVFAVEIGLRTLCMYMIDGNFTGIYMDLYNVCDVVAVGLNIAFLLVTPIMNAGAGFVIVLRCVKIYRMMQLSGARIIAGDDEEVKLDGYKVTARYSIAPIHELETMVEVVDILAFMQKLIEDRNISLAMHYFYAWENGSDRRAPADLFEDVVRDSKELSLSLAGFDDIMLDVLMFEHRPLTQSTLEVLMAHHSMRRTLLDNIQKVQLLASSKREKQYREVNAMLQELEQNAETHELWGELESDEDRETNTRTKEILQKLINICRIRRTVLEFDEDFEADTQIQDLYRNLGCFEICMKVMNLMDSVEEDEYGNLSEVALNTKDLCLQCNQLLYWFLLGNQKNQEQGYEELKFFLDHLDDGIKSHHVIAAIFKDNEALMRLVPHSHLDDLVERILKNGKSHHYLTLFASISNVGDRNIRENQFQIVKILTSPGRLQNVSCFFCSVNDPEYEEKRRLMAPLVGVVKDFTLDDLPPLLAYHLTFLDVLSDCTVGRFNVTTVEAKVQSVFSYVDILQSILDPGTIVFTQIRLSFFFYNSIIEVELKIPGLEQSAYIWQLLHTYEFVLGYAKDDLRLVEKAGWDSPEVSRQKIEYIMVCIYITGGFFARYYDANTFRFTEPGANPPPSDKVAISLAQVNDLIKSLFDKIKDVYDLDSPRLSAEMKDKIFDTLVALNKSASKIIVTNLMPTTSKLQTTASPETLSGEGKLIQKFQDFYTGITADAALMERCENENVNFIHILENLPKIGDKGDADVRYETLIRKLVQHIRDNFQYVNGQKRLDARVTKTSTWIIRIFRTMIENKMGMTILERDDDGGEEQDIAAAPVVTALNNCGATALCLDLIADGIDAELRLEAIRLGVGLLFKEGGALEVQTLMHTHLSKTNSELFFRQVRLSIAGLIAWHEWNENAIAEEDDVPEAPELLIVRFLQLMCEGHFLPNQDIMREQPNNPNSINLLDDLVGYFDKLSRNPRRTSTVAAIRLSATILEVIQGPCEGNQVHLALHTELIETLNRVNRAKLVLDCRVDEETDLKKTSIDIFQGLLEGQGEKSPVYERVLSVIHLDIIQMMSKGTAMPEVAAKGGKLVMPAEPTEEQIILQTECVVLLQMLCNFKPSLYDELGISKNIDDIVGSGTAMIEVVWRGDIHRRFFHVPAVCDFLAKSSKDALVENVDRSNAENKLIDFLARSHDLYREVKHQQYLTEAGVSKIFSPQMQDLATWITFSVAMLINVMFVAYYSYAAHDPRPSITDSSALIVVNAFNIFQNVVGLFVIVLNVVVRSPVIYQAQIAADIDPYRAALITASDPKTLYFCAYLVLSLLGLLAADYYLPFLLLDIVAKNATTRDVLNAVVIPRKQLGMTVVLAIFVTYIFAYFIFKYFRDDLGGLMGDGVYPGDNDCKTLWGCFKFVMCYGVRQGGGVGEMLKLSIGSRWLIDAAFFVVLVVMLLNIIFGIIIDTFSSLRANKNRRTEDTVGVCFICGINDQVFDRASDEPDGFKTHIKLDHNMWNYLYFIFMLWEQDKDDDDGLEQYVRRAIDASEITWFPLNKAIRLEQAATEEEITLRELSTEIQAFEQALGKKIAHFQSEMSHLLDTVSQATKIEHAKGAVKDGIAGYIRRSLIVVAPTDDGADNVDLAGGSAVLDTIDEDATLEDGSPDIEEGSQASGRGLGIVHEGDSDEDSEYGDEDEVVQRNTHTNSTARGAEDTLDTNSDRQTSEAPPVSQPAPFPGSFDEMEINSVIGGEPVMIREMSDRFWGIPGTPSTPASRPSMGEPQASYRRPDTAAVVETIEEEGHGAAAVEMGAQEGTSGREPSGPVLMDPSIAAEVELSEPAAAEAEEPPHSAEEVTTVPARESEEVRPETAAPAAEIVTEEAAATEIVDEEAPVAVEEDLVVRPATEAPTPAESNTDGAEDVAATGEITEDEWAVRPGTALQVNDEQAEESTQAADEDVVGHAVPPVLEEPSDVLAAANEAHDSTTDHLDAALPAPVEEDSFVEVPEMGEPVTVDELEPAAHEDSDSEHWAAEAGEPDEHEEREEQHDELQSHPVVLRRGSQSFLASVAEGEDEGAGDDAPFEPVISPPGEGHVEYLAGDSFRVDHVVDHDSVGAASDLQEGSVGGESLGDWARDHPTETETEVPGRDEAALIVEDAEPAAAASVSAEEGDLGDLQAGSFLGEESLMSEQTEASFAPEVARSVRMPAPASPRLEEEFPAPLQVEGPVEHVSEEAEVHAAESEPAPASAEGEENVDFDALDSEMNE